ncbi:hypothetical protein PoB_005329800 [Plakobranchus ocellatus]|uniref:Uncharacterized protein n=1 Tax=Plakobranchus ocellatus TaxID=259542 RepID=A0AAV4C5Q9_9GAST|nr:hypothetical protein PoB_005329800 [Plakobranchus ocellatus]
MNSEICCSTIRSERLPSTFNAARFLRSYFLNKYTSSSPYLQASHIFPHLPAFLPLLNFPNSLSTGISHLPSPSLLSAPPQLPHLTIYRHLTSSLTFPPFCPSSTSPSPYLQASHIFPHLPSFLPLLNCPISLSTGISHLPSPSLLPDPPPPPHLPITGISHLPSPSLLSTSPHLPTSPTSRHLTSSLTFPSA